MLASKFWFLRSVTICKTVTVEIREGIYAEIIRV